MENALVQALMYSLPALLVLGAVKIVLDWNSAKENSNRNFALRSEIIKQNFSLKLSAYERCVLFLERISPQQLFMRVPPVGKTAKQYVDEISMTIQAEYEHNITQQIYMSPQAWVALVKGKEELLGAFRQMLSAVPENADGLMLANAMVRWMEEQQFFPTQQAIHVLKTEAHSYFNT